MPAVHSIYPTQDTSIATSLNIQPEEIAEQMCVSFSSASPEEILEAGLEKYAGRAALVSSFGAESAIMLHMISRLDPSLPIITLDTMLLFPETHAYQKQLLSLLGLTNLQIVRPDETSDPDRTLHRRDSQACCALRKVEPLKNALKEFDAILTGRKRHQTRDRQTLKPFEVNAAGKFCINPLYNWSDKDTRSYMQDHKLPAHPLVAQGYPSIGCMPCTTAVKEGEDPRAGRWRNETRQECGIHFCPNGTVVRKAG